MINCRQSELWPSKIPKTDSHRSELIHGVARFADRPWRHAEWESSKLPAQLQPKHRHQHKRNRVAGRSPMLQSRGNLRHAQRQRQSAPRATVVGGDDFFFAPNRTQNPALRVLRYLHARAAHAIWIRVRPLGFDELHATFGDGVLRGRKRQFERRSTLAAHEQTALDFNASLPVAKSAPLFRETAPREPLRPGATVRRRA